MTTAGDWDLFEDPCLVSDLAHWQGEDVACEEMKELGFECVIAKTWHAAALVKSSLKQLESARAAGLPVGRYGFPLFDADEHAQVKAWTSFEREDDELTLMIDVEDDTTKLRGKPLVAVIERLIEATSDIIGERPIIYTGVGFWQKFCLDLDSEIVASCDLWLAAYPAIVSKGLHYRDAIAEIRAKTAPRVPKPYELRNLEPLIWQFDGDKGLLLPQKRKTPTDPITMKGDGDVSVAKRSWMLSRIPKFARHGFDPFPPALRVTPQGFDVHDFLANTLASVRAERETDPA